MKKSFLITLLFTWLYAIPCHAQSWEPLLLQLYNEEEIEEQEWDEMYETLTDLEQHPININNVTTDMLRQIPFLTDREIEDIEEYLYRYGTVTSIGELAMIPSVSYYKRQLLSFFLVVGPPQKASDKLNIKEIMRYGKHQILFSGKLPFYERKGDQEGYLGYPYRHQLRYQFQYRDRIKAGVVGSQDAGEPFFAGKNKSGYDNYAYYLQVNKIGPVQNLILGKYRVNIGSGLVINNGMSFGKSALLAGLENYRTTIRPHASSTANCLQGIAAITRLSAQTSLDVFLSFQHKDATLNQETKEIQTILTSGYHRTQAEMDKKGNITQQVAGVRFAYNFTHGHVGLGAVYTGLNKPFRCDTSAIYRQYYPQGKEFFHTTTEYQYLNGRLALTGETAISQIGAIASLNKFNYSLSELFDITLLQRFYSKKYVSLLSQAFSESGKVQNESGIYAGLQYHPSRQLSVSYYTDFAYFPWPRYQISAASHVWDQQLSVNYQHEKWTFNIRYRLKQKEKDDEDHQLTTLWEQKGRASIQYQHPTWSNQTYLQVSRIKDKETHKGFLISNHTHIQPTNRGKIYLQMTYFDTDDYDSRLYQYEQGPLYNSSFNMYAGRGIRYSLMMSYSLSKQWTLCTKIGTIDYFDRATIGSGNQQINHSSATEMDIQLKIKL